jgi:hypothetical protein
MSITESRIKAIEDRLDELTQNFLQTQKNQAPITAKTDNNSNELIKLNSDVSVLKGDIYPDWNPKSYPYFAGERVTYEGTYYRCIQNHTSQADWTPDTAVSLWVSISDPTEEYPEWIQPAGAHDAYEKGDKVSHLDKHLISDIDANVYEPSVYGWSEVE